MPNRWVEELAFRGLKETPAYLQELVETMDQLYPLATPENGVLDRVRSGTFKHCSFKLGTRFSVSCFATALANLTAEEGHVHAQAHDTFPLAVALLSQYLTTDLRALKLDQKPSGIVMQTPDLQREVDRPIPFNKAKDLSRSTRSRELVARKIKAASRDCGPGMGLLMACYINMHEKDIFQLFTDPNLKKFLEEKSWPFPVAKRTGDGLALNQLRTALLAEDEHGFHPRYSPKSYQQALRILLSHNWIPEEFIASPDYDYEIATDTVRAVAVFLGATEAALNLANQKNYPIRPLSPHIEKLWAPFCTTWAKTVYLPSAVPLLDWQRIR